MWLRTGRAAAVALALAGCLETRTIECADGRVCPAGTRCDDEHELCILDVQREACDGLAEDAECEFGSVTGHCDAGVCLRDGCGDGFATAGEECDRDDWR